MGYFYSHCWYLKGKVPYYPVYLGHYKLFGSSAETLDVELLTKLEWTYNNTKITRYKTNATLFLISSGSVDDIPYGLPLDCLSHFISVSVVMWLSWRQPMSERDSQASVWSLVSQDTRTSRSCWLELIGWWVSLQHLTFISGVKL